MWLAIIATSLPAAEWSQWRGPERNGIAPAADIRTDWPVKGPKVAWRADVGTGFSSLAVADGRLFTMGNTADIDTVYCLDAETGEALWQASYAAALDPNLFEGGPTATPAVTGTDVVTYSRQGIVLCFDTASGEERWRTNLPETCELNVPTWGFSGSPVVHGDLVLLTAGSAGVALDRKTGAVRWKSDNSDDAGYATPVMATVDDQPLALILSGKALHAIDPLTGRQLWEHRWITRYGVNAADPLVQGNQAFLSSGYAKGSSLLTVSKEKATEEWRMRDLRNQMSPGVVIDGSVYAVDGDAGEDCRLKCIEFNTGAVHWEEPELGSATLIACGTQLIVLSGDGELLIAPASKAGFQPVARARVLTGKCWTPPALAEARLYCRNAEGAVVCLDLR